MEWAVKCNLKEFSILHNIQKIQKNQKFTQMKILMENQTKYSFINW